MTKIEQTFTFGTNGNSRANRLHGWSADEAGFAWTVGAQSAFVTRYPDAPLGFFLEFQWHPFSYPPRLLGQPVTVTVNDRRVRSFELRHRGFAAIYCPPPQPLEHSLCIKLDHPEAARPRDVSGHHDTRELAICVRRIRVLVITSEQAQPPSRRSGVRLSALDVPGLAPEVETATGMPISDFLSGFEMLAGNCDMGLVQREFGVEPLSLLRFAGATSEVAIRGLDTGFDGIGESIVPEVSRDPNREWMVVDRYGLRYHSGQPSDLVSAQEIVDRERKKIGFLKRKFLQDLAEGRKVFVYVDQHGLALHEVLPLFLALNRHGPRRMLWLSEAGRFSQPGAVEEILPGLFFGTLGIFDPPLVSGHISVGGWMTALCNTRLLIGKDDPGSLL